MTLPFGLGGGGGGGECGCCDFFCFGVYITTLKIWITHCVLSIMYSQDRHQLSD